MDSVSEFIDVAIRVVTMGDFNYNLADPLSQGQQLVETSTEPDSQVLRFGSTSFHKAGSSELDFCTIAGLEVGMSSLKCGDFPWPDVNLFFNICQPARALPSDGPPVMRRSWCGYSADHFCSVLSCMDWSSACIGVVSIDTAAELLTSNFTSALNVLDPIGIVRLSSQQRKVWKIPELDALEKRYAKLHKRISNRALDLIKQFRALRFESQRLHSDLLSSLYRMGCCAVKLSRRSGVFYRGMGRQILLSLFRVRCLRWSLLGFCCSFPVRTTLS